MNKTYITEMPNHIGAFLQASRIFASLNINITRVSYNKAVDSHMLFIDVSGETQQLAKADMELDKIGYLQQNKDEPKIILIEFELQDIPGSVTNILELIEKHQLNISYMSSQENDTDYQLFKMGLFAENELQINSFIQEAKNICMLRVVDYNSSAKYYDNSIFYRSFISGLTNMIKVDEPDYSRLLVNANIAMQTLDEQGLTPFQTFDSIHCFAKMLSEYTKENFHPRITTQVIKDNTEIICIEPACGSNTFILKSNGKALFIDCGYACYKAEMEELFRKLLPDYDNMEKDIVITHADVDHCGLLPLFDRVYLSKKSAESLKCEFEGKDGLRERNPLHKPYIKICKILSKYKPTDFHKFVPLYESCDNDSLFTEAAFFPFGDFSFSVFEGAGGHLPGEIILVDIKNKLVFCGDIFVNLKDMIPEQKKYNRYAPILMTSVDTNSELCTREREKLFGMIDKSGWRIFSSHGDVKII